MVKKHALFLVFLAACLATPIAAEQDESLTPGVQLPKLFGQLWLTQTLGLSGPGTEMRGRLGTDPDFEGLGFIMDLSFIKDELYGASHADTYYGGFYFDIYEGGLSYSGKYASARAGRFFHKDALDSPYSLFVSSQELSAFLYEINLRTKFFSADTRAVELNRNSDHGYPDRSAYYKRFALHFGALELGYQDAIVAADPLPVGGVRPPAGDGSGPLFIPEYFFSPVPSLPLQFVLGSGERPWLMNYNHNGIMGLYTAYRQDGWEVQAQWLVDDMNWNRFLAPDDFQNPDKMAWMIGGRMETPLGSFGLWHAGALRYTFQAFGGGTGEGATDLMYSYTYYPETRFPRGDSMQAIPNRKNYFGLYLGENSAGFRLDWENQYSLPIEGSDDLAVNASLEFTLTGSQSPANPWGEYTTWFQHEQQGTRYLDDELLEKGIILTASGLWGGPPQAWGKLVGSVDIRAGVCLNALRLEAPREVGIDSASQDSQVNQAWIWYPSQEHEAVAEISLGLRYYFPKAK